ncbi:hypothetical protein [Desulfovibrio sp. TomC]|uniref:hypothetical protein n=1 Tax=Desulfovibrio sp. TomC TaxID=1562888 RepID=UPI0005759A87|nr:hypothetical protein [Desulfovibrio sp. TomC]KHK03451.1 hypothetical protein NY78_1036 [Desulfovibrio sp. TomC]
MAKNAYTFAKRSKELAKKKKKEEKLVRKNQRGDVEEGPVYDEATGQIIYPQAADAENAVEGAADGDAEAPAKSPDAVDRP